MAENCPICGRADKPACKLGAEADKCGRDAMLEQFGVPDLTEAWAKDEQAKRHAAEEKLMHARSEIARLRAALSRQEKTDGI